MKKKLWFNRSPLVENQPASDFFETIPDQDTNSNFRNLRCIYVHSPTLLADIENATNNYISYLTTVSRLDGKYRNQLVDPVHNP